MTRRLELLLHLGYWTLYLLLLAFLFVIVRAQAQVFAILFASRIGLLLIAPNLLAFYLAYLWFFPALAARKRSLPLVAVASAAVLATTFVFIASPPQETASLSVCLTLLALIHMVIALVMRGFLGWVDDLALKEELRRKTSEVETALVRAKLDPHFLFNTLNNIDVLILRDPAVASLYLNKLSGILRFVLYEARADRVPLEAELSYLDKYVELQRIRTVNPKLVSSNTVGDARGLMIAPMLLIPLVENAFKHAQGQRAASSIALEVAIEKKRVAFVCSNRYGTRETSGGLGNVLMRRRLALLYPQRHTFDIADQNGTYTASLTIDLDDTALHHR